MQFSKRIEELFVENLSMVNEDFKDKSYEKRLRIAEEWTIDDISKYVFSIRESKWAIHNDRINWEVEHSMNMGF